VTPSAFLSSFLIPGLQWCSQVPGWKIPSDPRATLFLLAAAGQESDWQDIAQYGGGPGRGPWQDEPETCGEILGNSASTAMALAVCDALSISPTQTAVWSHIIVASDMVLATAFARLDLWCDPFALPSYGNLEDCYDTYIRVWQPGLPSLSRWKTVYPQALAAMPAQEQENDNSPIYGQGK